MKLNFNTFTAMTLFFLAMTTTSYAQLYCDNGANSADYFWIESVSSGDFYHSAGANQGQLDDQDHLYHGYVDYTDHVIEWKVGLNPLNLEPGLAFQGYPLHWQVWIDLNTDHIFSEDELVLSESSQNMVNNQVDLSDLRIDDDLTTRMRISARIFQPAPVCGGFDLGEVEDYSLTIKGPLRVPEAFNTIQSAIDAALPGERILVNDGVYNEALVIDKAVILDSKNGSEMTNITGLIGEHTIWVQSPNVVINGFDLTGQRSALDSGIFFDTGSHDGQALNIDCGVNINNETDDWNVSILESDRVTVSGLKCDHRGQYGIWAEHTNDSQFVDNVIKGKIHDGIFVRWASNLLIDGNTLNENFRTGLTVASSDDVTISNNDCSRNFKVPEPLHKISDGINVINSSEIIVVGNECNDNEAYGILINWGNHIQVYDNNFNDNENNGAFTHFNNDIVIENNTFNNNQGQGLSVNGYNHSGLLLDGNTFIGNAAYGLKIDRMRNSQVMNNLFLNNEGEVSFNYTESFLLTNNRFESNAGTSLCKFDMKYSRNNRFYLNEFILPPVNGMCSDSISINDWNSETELSYEYQNNSYLGFLGNYYSLGNHDDLDGNGVSDAGFVLPLNEGVDYNALSETLDEYIIQ